MPTIVKGSATDGNATAFHLGDIALEARSIIARAERQAEQIIAEAHQAAEAVRQQGREAGQAEGRREGAQAAHEEAGRLFEQRAARSIRLLAETVEQLARRKEQMLAEARQELVALALAVAEKVVRGHIAADPQTCQRTVEAAVELAGRASRLIVKAHPADLDTIRELAPALASRLSEEADVQVVADESVEAGGCRVITWRDSGQTGEVDGTIQTQLTRLANELLGRPVGG